MADAVAPPAPPAPKRKWYQSRIPLRVRLLVALPVAALVGLALAPTRLRPLSVEHPKMEDRSRRRPPAPGCGLDSVEEGGACRPVVVANVRDEQVNFPSSIPDKGLAALRGTLSVPDAPGKRPAVILLHGSGPQDRDAALPGDLVSRTSPPFPVLRALGEVFARAGFVVLRWDKRGPKNYPELSSPSHAGKFRFVDFETDGRDAIAWLAGRAEVDPGAIVVAGHSEGGGLVGHVAAGDRRIAGAVLFGGYVDAFDAAEWQLGNHARTRLRQADLVGYGALTFMASRQRRCIEKLGTAEYDPNERCIGGSPTQAQVKDVVAYESHTMDRLASLECPIMAIQGSVDRNIDPTTLPRLGKALERRDVELHYVPGVNHLMVDVVDGQSPPALDPRIAALVRTFVGSLRRRGP